MKRVVFCVLLSWCISSGHSNPQGFFGGLLPTSSPQGETPPKGPLAIFTQGQQTAQNFVMGIASSLSETRDKIRNETKKRIQSLLKPMENKDKEEVTSEKPHDVKPNNVEVEMLPEKLEQASPDNKEQSSGDKGKEQEKEDQEQKDTLKKLKQTETIDKKESTKKPDVNNDSTHTEELTTPNSAEIDKLIEDIFATSEPSKENGNTPIKEI